MVPLDLWPTFGDVEAVAESRKGKIANLRGENIKYTLLDVFSAGGPQQYNLLGYVRDRVEG